MLSQIEFNAVFSTRPSWVLGNREYLTAAHEACTVAAQQSAAAAEAAGRGRAAFEAAEAHLADFAEVDQAVAAHRAAALRAGGNTDLPVALAARRKRYAAAQQEAEDASRTVALLDGEAAAAKNVEAAARQVFEVEIIGSQAQLSEQLAIRMRELQVEAGRLRVIATSLQNHLPMGSPHMVVIAPTACDVLHDYFHPILCELSNLSFHEGAALWGQFAKALRENPQAPAPAELSPTGAAAT